MPLDGADLCDFAMSHITTNRPISINLSPSRGPGRRGSTNKELLYETDSAALADRRAKMVAGLLINRYQVDPKKIAMSSSAGEGATVELVLARNN